jgi:hypothetical protein
LGNALSFDGSTGYLNCGTESILDLGDGDKGTVEVWIKANSWPPDEQYPSIIGSRENGGWNAGAYHISYWNNYLRFVIYETGVGYVAISKAPPSIGVWHHLAMTWNGIAGGRLNAYIDGTLAGYVPQTRKANSGIADDLLIGRSSGYYFNGLIDEARIYNRALTAAEIQQHYAGGLERRELAEASSPLN